MTQITTALPAVGRRPAARAKPGTASAGPRFLKLLAAVILIPVLGLLLVALADIHFAAQLWRHADSGATLPWRRLTQTLPGLLGLGLLGAAAGVWFQALATPERWLNRYAGRLLGAQDAPGAEGSFLIRWCLFELPLGSLAALAVHAGLQALGYPTAAEITLCAAPLCFGLYLAQLARQLSWQGNICREDGTLFAWASTAVAQLTWLAAGCVFFLQAKPVWQFAHEWFQAAAVRAIQLCRLFER